MATLVTVEADKIEAFRQALPATGCRLTGRRRRLGRARDGARIRDLEIVLPPRWRDEMAADLGKLPGFRDLFFQGRRGGPWGGPWQGESGGWREAVESFVFWWLTPSGSHPRRRDPGAR